MNFKKKTQRCYQNQVCRGGESPSSELPSQHKKLTKELFDTEPLPFHYGIRASELTFSPERLAKERVAAKSQASSCREPDHFNYGFCNVKHCLGVKLKRRNRGPLAKIYVW